MAAAAKTKKGNRGKSPMEMTGELVHVENAPEVPELELLDLDAMSDDMLYRFEMTRARAAAYSFQSFLIHLCYRHGIPMDNALPALELLVLWVECELAARVAEPDMYERADAPTEAHAYADHLTVTERPAKRKRVQCTLPGCQGHIIDGVKCEELRPYGSRFCTRHEREYLALYR